MALPTLAASLIESITLDKLAKAPGRRLSPWEAPPGKTTKSKSSGPNVSL